MFAKECMPRPFSAHTYLQLYLGEKKFPEHGTKVSIFLHKSSFKMSPITKKSIEAFWRKSDFKIWHFLGIIGELKSIIFWLILVYDMPDLMFSRLQEVNHNLMSKLGPPGVRLGPLEPHTNPQKSPQKEPPGPNIAPIS